MDNREEVERILTYQRTKRDELIGKQKEAKEGSFKYRRLQKKIDKWTSTIEEYEKALDDPLYLDEIQKGYEDNNVFGRLQNSAEKTSDNLRTFSDKTAKAGLHLTGATWAPGIYLAYQTVKSAKRASKSDLVKLIKEVEEAENKGAVSPEQAREYIVTFVNDYYK